MKGQEEKTSGSGALSVFCSGPRGAVNDHIGIEP